MKLQLTFFILLLTAFNSKAEGLDASYFTDAQELDPDEMECYSIDLRNKTLGQARNQGFRGIL